MRERERERDSPACVYVRMCVAPLLCSLPFAFLILLRPQGAKDVYAVGDCSTFTQKKLIKDMVQLFQEARLLSYMFSLSSLFIAFTVSAPWLLSSNSSPSNTSYFLLRDSCTPRPT